MKMSKNDIKVYSLTKRVCSVFHSAGSVAMFSDGKLIFFKFVVSSATGRSNTVYRALDKRGIKDDSKIIFVISQRKHTI